MLRSEYCLHCGHNKRCHHRRACNLCECDHLECAPARRSYQYNTGFGQKPKHVAKVFPRGRITSAAELRKPADKRYHEAI